MNYITECPRCGRKIGSHDLYCRPCSREMGQSSGMLEKHRGVHFFYTLLLVAANVTVIAYLFWVSYMK